MIFTDLDKTLIYSERFLNKYKIPIVDCTVVESTDKVTSYISNKTIEILKSIEFVPTTARTEEQYRRLNLPHHRIAIVENGAKILIDGSEIKEWSDIVKSKLSRLTLLPEDIIKRLSNYKIIDNKFIVTKDIDFDININDEWTIYKGRESYIVPNFIKKDIAVKYVCDYLECENYFCMGDAETDLDMILNSTNRAIAGHSDITHKNLVRIKDIGFLATENILGLY